MPPGAVASVAGSWGPCTPLTRQPPPGGGEEPAAGQEPGTLIIDSPGVEGLGAWAATFPHPWCLVPHPVVAKRSWRLPLGPADRCCSDPPEVLLPQWGGTVVVGESLLLLAALRLRAPGVRLVLALPPAVDAHLRGRVAAEAAADPLIRLVEA